MATPVLNNGIFLRDTAYNASSHVDSYHLVNMLKDAEPMDLGPVDLWAMAQKVEMPLYQMSSFGGKNVIQVDNARGDIDGRLLYLLTFLMLLRILNQTMSSKVLKVLLSVLN